MNNLSRDAIPRAAFELAQRFSDAGFRLWLVGGWVRDALLGRLHTDLDFATDARPEQTLKILRSFGGRQPWTAGIEYGTVGVQHDNLQLEVTTLRREAYDPGSRHPEVVYGDDIETDLSRRDFTVNTMAIALPDVQVLDPYGGLSDLVAKRIRTPLSPEISFSDDPLRMLRAFRFASALGFDVDPAARQAIGKMHGRIGIVSAERIRDEFSKLMLGQAVPQALKDATDAGLCGEFLPELPGLKLEQDPIHRHKDVFLHTLAVLANAIEAEQGPADLGLRLGALLHDIGKPATRQITPKGVTFHHHEVVGAHMAEARMKKLKFSKHLIDEVTQLVYLHLRLHTFRLGWSDRAVRRYVRDAGDYLDNLNALIRADCTTRNPRKAEQLATRMDQLEERIADLRTREELAQLRPALNGNEVMELLQLNSGPDVGRALDFLMELRLDEGELSKQEASSRLTAWYKEQSSSA
ncbi:MAG: CCA tRNA nucleotidyltransferase [Actinomycetota bacterium]